PRSAPSSPRPRRLGKAWWRSRRPRQKSARRPKSKSGKQAKNEGKKYFLPTSNFLRPRLIDRIMADRIILRRTLGQRRSPLDSSISPPRCNVGVLAEHKRKGLSCLWTFQPARQEQQLVRFQQYPGKNALFTVD